jgi:MFS family permease
LPEKQSHLVEIRQVDVAQSAAVDALAEGVMGTTGPVDICRQRRHRALRHVAFEQRLVAALWLAYGGLGSATPSRVLWAVLGFAIAIYVLAGATALAIVLFGMVLFGFFGETRRTGTVSLMQSKVHDSQRGRVMSTLFLFTQIAGAVGTLTVGLGATWTGLRLPLLVSAIVLTFVWLCVYRRRHAVTQAFAADA